MMNMDEVSWGNVEMYTTPWGEAFHEIEMQLFLIGMDFTADQHRAVEALRAKYLVVKSELEDCLEASKEALKECERSGDNKLYIVKYRIINDYAHQLVMDLKKAVAKASLVRRAA